MPRPQRLLFPYGVWHLTSRGVDGRLVFLDDYDRRLFLVYLCRVVREFGWRLHAYCLMGNTLSRLNPMVKRLSVPVQCPNASRVLSA